MQRFAPVMFWIGILAVVAGAQLTPQPHFEVASVKPGGDVFSTRPNRSTGRFRWTTQLCYLIGYANDLDFSRVSSKNCGSVYSVEATFGPAATDREIRLMLQSLLADRFKMRAHRVTTEADGYALLIGRRGLKIKEAKPTAEPPGMPDWIKDASPTVKAESFISLAAMFRCHSSRRLFSARWECRSGTEPVSREITISHFATCVI